MTSSAAIPTVFPPIAFQDKLMMDGGTIWNTNIQQALDMCTNVLGHDDANITVDILIASTPDSIKQWDHSNMSAVTNYMRANRIGKSHKGVDTVDAT